VLLLLLLLLLQIRPDDLLSGPDLSGSASLDVLRRCHPKKIF
jgi:hypothetical protein